MLGEKIKHYRKINGWTQSELAAKLGVSTSTIGMYEQNRRAPDLNKIKHLSECFGIGFEELSIGELTQNDKGANDIMKKIHQILQELEQNEKLTFRGLRLSSKDIGNVKNAMIIGAVVALENMSKSR